jgi:serine/threonine protein kinase
MNAPKLDRYEVLGRLATGGMAEVWLARTRGIAGFQKLVVVKTILPGLANVPQFVSMFIAEAQLAAMLTHPNCIQIFDLGQENGVLYIAMEFLEGFSFARILNRAKQKGVRLEDRVLARILMDAASGLDHAHRFVDREGRHLALVHRDVSPDNLLVGFSGQVKVVDFGIAKAATPAVLSVGTMVGTVKGKHGYIAPEYLAGKLVDARADLFALGVVLYRSITGKRPFRGDSEAEVSFAVLQEAPRNPLEVNPDANPALASVALKALEKDPNQRFESARAMRQAMEAAVGRAADSEEVAELMDALWPRGDPDRVALDSLASGSSEESSHPVLRAVSGTYPSVNVATPARAPGRTRGTGAKPAPLEPPVVQGEPLVEEAPVAEDLPVTEDVPIAPAPAAAPQAVFFENHGHAFEAPPRSKLPLVVSVIALLLAAGAIALLFARDRATPTPAVVAPVPAPVPVAAPTPTPGPGASAATGHVRIATTPSVTVFSGKNELGASPLELDLPAGPVTLRLVNKAVGIDQEHALTVTTGGTVTLDELVTGRLVVKAEPWAIVKVDGKKYGETPVTVSKLFEGPHAVELENSNLHESRRVLVTVKRGETRTVSVDFESE